MDDYWDFTTLCSDNNRDGNETSLGEYNIGFQLFEKLFGFMKSFENAERIREVLGIEITS